MAGGVPRTSGMRSRDGNRGNIGQIFTSAGQNHNPAIRLKIPVIGDVSVGTSSLIMRFSENKFKDTSRVPLDYVFRTMEIDGETVEIFVWGTLRRTRRPSIPEELYRHAYAILLVYDVTSHASFYSIRKYIQNIEISEHSIKGVKFVLVANKADLEDQRVISKEQGLDLANELNVPFFETSAKTGTNVDAAFSCVARESKHLHEQNPTYSCVQQSEAPALSSRLLVLVLVLVLVLLVLVLLIAVAW